MKVDLAYPAKALWPNGRAHHHAKAREVKKHRAWAHIAALEALQRDGSGGLGAGPIPLRITVHGKPRGPLPDKDGVVGAAKSLIDGIADALRINDKHFDAPTVEFAPDRSSRFVIEVGHG
jgi:crossover junction endodeoxyribonuclease RusA